MRAILAPGLAAVLVACAAAPVAPRPVAPRPAAPVPSVGPVAPVAPVGATWEQLHGPIRAFSITGGEDIDYLRLQPLFNDEVGQPLDRARLRGKLARAMAGQTLADVSLSGVQLPDGIRLVVQVRPQPAVADVALRSDGADQPPPAALKALVGERLAPTALDAAAAALRDALVEEGRVGAAVTWRTEARGERVAVILDATPGERIVIAAHSYDGAHGVSAAALDAVIAQDAAIGAPWIADRIERAALRVNEYYWDHGYAQIQVKLDDAPTRNPATLVMHIVEGPVFHLGAITVTGVPPAEAARLRARIALRSGELFTRIGAVHARELLLDEMVKAGHRHADVTPLTTIDPNAHTIAIAFEIAPGA